MAAVERTTVTEHDGDNSFGGQTTSTTSNNNSASTITRKNEAGNLPFEFDSIGLDQVPVSSGDGIFRNVDVASLALGSEGDANLGNVKFISEKADLPTAVGGIITLLPNVTYYFTDSVDLTGDRLVCSANTCILGASSENAFITSTGLGVGIPLLYSEYTLPVRHVTFHDVDTGFHLNGQALGGYPSRS